MLSGICGHLVNPQGLRARRSATLSPFGAWVSEPRVMAGVGTKGALAVGNDAAGG